MVGRVQQCPVAQPPLRARGGSPDRGDASRRQAPRELPGCGAHGPSDRLPGRDLHRLPRRTADRPCAREYERLLRLSDRVLHGRERDARDRPLLRSRGSAQRQCAGDGGILRAPARARLRGRFRASPELRGQRRRSRGVIARDAPSSGELNRASGIALTSGSLADCNDVRGNGSHGIYFYAPGLRGLALETACSPAASGLAASGAALATRNVINGAIPLAGMVSLGDNLCDTGLCGSRGPSHDVRLPTRAPAS
jgi:hypothetical protein